MRELERRLRLLEETKLAASAPAVGKLGDFYAALHDPDHADHGATVRSLEYFYGRAPAQTAAIRGA